MNNGLSWKEEHKNFIKERKSFIDYFDKNRQCRCKIESCKHLKNTEVMLQFRHKAWELHIKFMNDALSKLEPLLKNGHKPKMLRCGACSDFLYGGECSNGHTQKTQHSNGFGGTK